MSPANRPSGRLRAGLFVSLGLASLTLLVYGRSIDHAFVNYDDPEYVTENPHVQPGLTAENLGWAFTSGHFANWHPLTWLSLQLDSTLYGGPNAMGCHVTNVLLHTANTLLLFWALNSMTGALWRSALVAALFALHPLHVESVAWVAERKGLVSTLGWMLALLAYHHYVRRPGVGRYLLVALALLLGLMAKPMLLTLPGVLLLLDYWPLGRWKTASTAVGAPGAGLSLWRLLREKVPLVVVVLGFGVVAFTAQRSGGALPSLARFPLDVRLGNALVSYADYLGQTFWPLRLAVFYPHPGRALSVASALGAALLLAGITALVLGPGRRWPYLAVGWLWYTVTLIPVIGLVQIGGHARADRYTYVPSIGLFLLFTWGIGDLMAAWHLPRLARAVVGALVLIACAALTWVQLGYWRDSLTLWEHTIAVTDDNALAHYNLGTLLTELGRPNEAQRAYRRSIELDPEYASAHLNLGSVLHELGRPEEAINEYQRAIDLDPNLARAHANLGTVLAERGQLTEARAAFREAIAHDATFAPSHYGLAKVLTALGQHDEAIAEYRRAMELDPSAAAPHNNLGNVLRVMGRRQDAMAEFRRAMALDPYLAQAPFNLGLMLQEEGRFAEAILEFRRAMERGHPMAQQALRQCERLQALPGTSAR